MNCIGIFITAARLTPSGVKPAVPAREVNAH
jgi:hypothetical protein